MEDDYGVHCHTDLAIMFAVDLRVFIVEAGSYFPNRTRLPLAGDINPIGEARTAQRVVIKHSSMVLEKPVSITVVYIHLSVFVGLYTGSGSILYFSEAVTSMALSVSQEM